LKQATGSVDRKLEIDLFSGLQVDDYNTVNLSLQGIQQAESVSKMNQSTGELEKTRMAATENRFTKWNSFLIRCKNQLGNQTIGITGIKAPVMLNDLAVSKSKILR